MQKFSFISEIDLLPSFFTFSAFCIDLYFVTVMYDQTSFSMIKQALAASDNGTKCIR